MRNWTSDFWILYYNALPLSHRNSTVSEIYYEVHMTPMRNWTSDFWILCSDALPLSHRNSTVSEVYYEVHMTCILHTARISNVDSLMLNINRNLSHTRDKMKNFSLYFFTALKTFHWKIEQFIHQSHRGKLQSLWLLLAGKMQCCLRGR